MKKPAHQAGFFVPADYIACRFRSTSKTDHPLRKHAV